MYKGQIERVDDDQYDVHSAKLLQYETLGELTS